MNGKELFSGMSFVEERLVGEAETERAPSGRVAWKRWTAIAACLCVLVLSVFAFELRPDGGATEGIAGQDAADSMPMPMPMPVGGEVTEMQQESMESEANTGGDPVEGEIPNTILCVKEMTEDGFIATVTDWGVTDVLGLGTELKVIVAEGGCYEVVDGERVTPRDPDFTGRLVLIQFYEFDPDSGTIAVDSAYIMPEEE